MKSLVTFEHAMYSHRSSCSGRKMPKGVNVAVGLKSWSAALVLVRLLPRRENGPIWTVALASIEIRRMSSARSASGLTSFSGSKMASVCLTFFGGGSWPPW
jgi:hypothetical protein